MTPPLNTSKAVLSTPPDSPLPSEQYALAIPSSPASPPTTESLDPSPRPLHVFDPLSQSVSKILQIIRSRYEGKSTEGLQASWERYALNPKEYWQLQNALDKDKDLKGWVEDKLRYDYDSVRGELTLRMPSQVHSIFARGLDGEIIDAIKKLESAEYERWQCEIHEAVRKIRVDSDSNVRFQHIDDKDFKTPDSSIAFDKVGIKYPPVLIEVAHSQRRKKLPELVEFYIEQTGGDVKTVIAVDIEYRRPIKPSKSTANGIYCPTPALGREAVFSIYRHQVVDDDETGDQIREAHSPGSRKSVLPQTRPHKRRQAEMDKETPPIDKDRPERRLRFRSKRKRSPTPGLTNEREAVFRAAEDKDDARAEEKDPSFEATSSFSTVEDDLPQRRKKIKTGSGSES